MINMISKTVKIMLMALLITMLPGISRIIEADDDPKTLAVGTTYYINETVKMETGKWYLWNDEPGSNPSCYSVDTLEKIQEPTFQSGQFKFTGSASLNLYIGYGQALTGAETVTGFKCVSGDGTQEDPFSFEVVFTSFGAGYGVSGDGSVSYESDGEISNLYYDEEGRIVNFGIEPEGSLVLTATLHEGFVFSGWYEGVLDDNYFVQGHTEKLAGNDKTITINKNSPYKFVQAVFAKPVLNLHFSSIDDDDLCQPIVISTDCGTTIKDALSSISRLFNKELFKLDGYQDSLDGRYAHPVSYYAKSGGVIPESDRFVEADTIEKGTHVYVFMQKKIDQVKINIVSPEAGSRSDTPKEGDIWYFNKQTNPPEVSVSSGSHCSLYIEDGSPAANWITDDKTLDPFIGTFVAGEKYTCLIWLRADYGYCFSQSTAYEFENSELIRATNPVGISRPIIMAYAKVPARNKFTLTFDLNGGTYDGKTGSYTISAFEDTTVRLPIPYRAGREFDYWEGSRYEGGAEYKVSEAHAFKAVWKDEERSSRADSSAYKLPKTGIE